MLGNVRAAIALFVMASAITLVVPTQIIALKTRIYSMNFGARWCHWTLAKALGFRITRTGTPSAQRPLLMVGNHVSWTDIVVLGSMIDGSFIAKGEMAGWPFLGWLATLQRTLFVNRRRRGTSGEQANDLASRLTGNDPMMLFAEGTTGDGNIVQPFKSTLFGAADLAIREGKAETVYIQPVAIIYSRFHGMPMNRLHRPLAAWIGDTDLWPHMRLLLREGAMDVEVIFGEPVPYTAVSKRKQVAREMEESVRLMVTARLRDTRKAPKAAG